jgi:hypothetical protein
VCPSRGTATASRESSSCARLRGGPRGAQIGTPDLAPRRGPLPIVVGVTGHRDLRTEDLLQLEVVVRSTLHEISSRYPHTSLVVLSGLAAGADQLVARVAVGMGLRLIASLPMPLAMYERDFDHDPDLLQSFRELLAKAAPRIELPLLTDAGLVADPGSARDEQYAQLARYLVQHAQILIALWDGRETQRVGGTAHVVRLQLEGTGPSPGQLDVAETGSVYHVVTPRYSAPEPIGTRFQLIRSEPADAGDNDRVAIPRADILKNTDEFNADACRLSGKLTAARALSQDYLLAGSPIGQLSVGPTTVLQLYLFADTVSHFYQQLAKVGLLGAFGIAIVGAGFFALFAHMSQNVLFLIPYVGVLGLAMCWPLLRDRVGWRAKYLDYRALAEALRVQLFWELAGISEPVANHYLRKHAGELRWIRYALRAALLPLASDQPGSSASAPDRDTVAQQPDFGFLMVHWVQHQRDYFGKAVERHRTHLRRTHLATILCLGSATLITLLIVAWFSPGVFKPAPEWLLTAAAQFKTYLEDRLGSPAPPAAEDTHVLLDLLILLTTLLVIAGATLASFADKMAWEDEAKQYVRMQTLHSRAAAGLKKETSDGDRRMLLRELGREALAENGDWVVLRRSRVADLTPSG